jgi:hypothetical protein
MIIAFLRVTPCSVVEICQIFDGIRSFQLEGTLKLKVMRFSETIVRFFSRLHGVIYRKTNVRVQSRDNPRSH